MYVENEELEEKCGKKFTVNGNLSKKPLRFSYKNFLTCYTVFEITSYNMPKTPKIFSVVTPK